MLIKKNATIKGGKKIENKILNWDEEDYPQKLLEIRDYPEKLHYLGNKELLNNRKVVAIVGSRNCTEYGRKFARKFAKELSQEGICIISGLAVGIDTAAHFGAVLEQGSTIAVLGGGLNNIYPKSNKWLFNEIATNDGCIISEHEDDAETCLEGFPKRNRIISGIADGVLVIEAEYRSGSKITARYAKEQGKKVFCIPSNLDSKNGVGTNNLIKEGAILVTNANDIIKKLYDDRSDSLGKQLSIMPVSEEYRDVYNLLQGRDMTNDEISRSLNIEISKMNSILTMMELEGYIEQAAGSVFKIKGKDIV